MGQTELTKTGRGETLEEFGNKDENFIVVVLAEEKQYRSVNTVVIDEHMVFMLKGIVARTIKI